MRKILLRPINVFFAAFTLITLFSFPLQFSQIELAQAQYHVSSPARNIPVATVYQGDYIWPVQTVTTTATVYEYRTTTITYSYLEIWYITRTITWSALYWTTTTTTMTLWHEPTNPAYPFLAHESGTGKVYYIFDGKKHWITCAEAFVQYGFRWGQILMDYPNLDQYETSYSLDGFLGRHGYTPLPSRYLPDGSLIGDKSTGAIFYVYQGNKFWIRDPSAFLVYEQLYGFNWSDVLWFDQTYIMIYGDGYHLDGTRPPPGY